MEPADGGQSPRLLDDGVLVSRTRQVGDVSFRAFLAREERPRVAWTSPDGLEIAGGGRAAWLTASGSDRFEQLRSEAERLFDRVQHAGPPVTRPRLIGGFAFDTTRPTDDRWAGFPPAGFVLPTRQVSRWNGDTYLTVNRIEPEADPMAVETDLDRFAASLANLPTMGPSGGPPGIESTRRLTSRSEWAGMVNSALRRIRRGELTKVVLATAMEVDLASPIDIPALLERLRRTYPDCYRILIQPVHGQSFFGPSPERLVAKRGDTVETEALAGSVGRGETPERDDTLAASLRDSPKLQHEQDLVVEAIRRRLKPLGPVTMHDRDVRRLATIQHLRTPISATLDEPLHVLSLVERLHPTPAVGGVPPDQAMETIRRTESFDRGWYASPVGWFDADGNGEFAVAIRSGLAKGRRATLFAGNGIVADSDPDDEWDEIHPKYRPILDELE